MIIGTGIGIPFKIKGGIDTYEILTDGDCIWRIGARDGNIEWDHTLTDDGFSGTEDIDWYNAQSE